MVRRVRMSNVSLELRRLLVRIPKPFSVCMVDGVDVEVGAVERSETEMSRKWTSFSLDHAGRAVMGRVEGFIVVID